MNQTMNPMNKKFQITNETRDESYASSINLAERNREMV